MKELIQILRRQGINGIRFPDVKTKCEEQWNEGYAIVKCVYPDPLYEFCNDATVADNRDDVEKFVEDFFGNVLVAVHWQRGEIEVSHD